MHCIRICTLNISDAVCVRNVSAWQDIELSKEINDSFKQSSQARTKLPPGIEISVHVLTMGWVPLRRRQRYGLGFNKSA